MDEIIFVGRKGDQLAEIAEQTPARRTAAALESRHAEKTLDRLERALRDDPGPLTPTMSLADRRAAERAVRARKATIKLAKRVKYGQRG